jgi:hypothetical protein
VQLPATRLLLGVRPRCDVVAGREISSCPAHVCCVRVVVDRIRALVLCRERRFAHV